MDTFLHAINRAREGLNNHLLEPPQIDIGQIQKKVGQEGAWEEMLVNPFPNVNMIASLPSEKFLQEKMNDLSMRNGEVNILWMLQALTHSGLFSQGTLPSPAAISTFKVGLSTGPAARIKNLFFFDWRNQPGKLPMMRKQGYIFSDFSS